MATKAIKKPDTVHIFTWEGRNKQGKIVKGESNGANITIVRAELRRQGIAVSKVKEKPKSLFGGRKKPIESKDISIFARQLATMMQAGVPLVQSFDIIGRGHEKPLMQDMLLGIKADIESGTALAASLRKQPLYFDDLFCNLVEAGEAAGILEDLLDKIATYKEKTESLKAKIKKALTYPIAVMVVAVVVTAIIMIFVIPQFENLFQGFGADLPAFTQLVVQMSKFVSTWWWLMLGVIMGTVSGFGFAYKRSRKMRENMDRLLLKIPAIGIIMHKAAIARFSRTLSTMFAAGVPLVEALDSVAGATGNVIYSNATENIREEVASGQSLFMSIKMQNLFPHMVVQMVAIGEEAGSLDAMLAKVADFYEEEVDNAVDNLSSMMEPMIMSFLGVVIGGLVIAMYMPIFQMGAAISGG